MTLIKTFSIAAVCSLIGLGSALAQGTGSEGYFQIYNNTDQNTVVGFYTNDGSGWSDNWLDERLAPGENAKATFASNSGPCEQTFLVGWLGADGGEVKDEPVAIDICKASNVYLDDNEMYYD